MVPKWGKLVVKVAKNKVPIIQVEIHGKLFNPAGGEVSQTVLDRLTEFDGKEVEFEQVGGQPKRIREIGGSFILPRQGTHAHERDGGRGMASRGVSTQSQGRPQQIPSGTRPNFHNPYNFVPAPPRNTADPELGDQSQIDQSTFHPDRYSGWVRVRMIAKTPLLVPNTEQVREDTNGHKAYPLRVGSDGKPLIPASSIRGMLRSAYETITNSRFGRFSTQHQQHLAFRMPAADSLKLIPARIANGQIHLLTGTSRIGAEGKPDGPMYAAWLPRYNHKGEIANWAIRYPDRNLPTHSDEVVCWVEKIHHSNPNFFFWRVRKMVQGNNHDQLGSQPNASDPRRNTETAHPQEMKRIHGWVCITNANINRKHDERVFFRDVDDVPGPFVVTERHKQMWRELIKNYQDIHEDDLVKRKRRNQLPDDYLGSTPGETAWSRHIYTAADRKLTESSLCYVRLNADRSDVEALFPVMIARELYGDAPWDLLDASLRPAAVISELSPADRVFGWVKADANRGTHERGNRVAVRGLLRVGPVTCLSNCADALDTFEGQGIPLAVLAAPKPQQGRFYVAQSPDGRAQQNRLSKKDVGYKVGKGLRGRKVYPHQRNLPNGYWDHPMEDRTQREQGSPTHYQEYRRPQKDAQEQRDDQNRSILGWVKPSAEFMFDLHVQNLSAAELGALLWLLELPEEHFLRFGGGKPLGFGSVRLSIEACDVCTGDELIARYRTWHEDSALKDPRKESVDIFKQAVVRAYSSNFADASFIRAFLIACRGHNDGLPTHYPRATDNGQIAPPSPQGESFKWFAANERNGAQYALSDLVSDDGLPTLRDEKSKG